MVDVTAKVCRYGCDADIPREWRCRRCRRIGTPRDPYPPKTCIREGCPHPVVRHTWSWPSEWALRKYCSNACSVRDRAGLRYIPELEETR